MPPRLSSLALALAALLAIAAPGVAFAQDGATLPDGSALPTLPAEPLEESDGQATGDEGLPASPDDLAGILGGTPVEPGGDGAPAEPTPVPDAGAGVQATTPVPPSYLAPGPGAAQQPIRGVAALSEPDVPLEPLRLGALGASLLAILLIVVAAVLRALGVRTPVVDPVPTPAGGPVARAGERARGIADDMRDFLRRTR